MASSDQRKHGNQGTVRDFPKKMREFNRILNIIR